MKTYRRTLHSVLLSCLLLAFSPAGSAEEESHSYGYYMGSKTLNGFTNIVTSWLEIPKNAINATNDSNIFWGLTGGTAKGIINMAGRIGVGVADLVTFWLPTEPIAQPDYIWKDFDVDTTYGDVFRLKREVFHPENDFQESLE